MDALSDVLRTSQLSGGVYLHAEFSEPWCIGARTRVESCARFGMQPEHLICYHYVASGRLQVKCKGEEPIHVAAGDVVLFPRNDVHLMGSDLSLAPVSVADILQEPKFGTLFGIRHGGGGPVTKVICGFLGTDDIASNPVIAALPPVLKLSVEEAGAAEWIRSTFQFAADEVSAGHPGSATVLSKLSEVLFVEAIRRYTESMSEEEMGWLAGLRDPYVARALALLHGDIAKDWMVEDLAAEVGLSRSAFADRFSRLIGKSPKQYLMGWRMQRASQMLTDSSLSISQIAGAVGYESDAAFSRAFKKALGAAPATWRQSKAS